MDKKIKKSKKIKNIFNNIKNRSYSFTTIILIFLLSLLLISSITIMLVNILIKKEIIANWEIVYYISQTINVLITLTIPLIIFYMQKKSDKKENKDTISKIELESRLEKIEHFIDDNQFFVTEQSKPTITKNDIFKYICINEGCTVKEISDNYKVDISIVKELITELCLFDKLITSTLDVDSRNPSDDSNWFRRN